ncbi:unnamed protein product [Rotaria sp. Silwood1]|nr:unnamed protein product [Rotaria sp. Silwood1]CAF4603995.1 unnamed protein product [Rotaria sp. Silwood1]
MGNSFKRRKGTAQVAPKQSLKSSNIQQQQQQLVPYNPPMVQQQPQVAFQADPTYFIPMNTIQTTHENDILLSRITGWSIPDIQRLRRDYFNYTNQYGIIDRDGFRKLYIASLLNTPWPGLEFNSEAAFYSFDVNHTGALDFDEFMLAYLRMTKTMS